MRLIEEGIRTVGLVNHVELRGANHLAPSFFQKGYVPVQPPSIRYATTTHPNSKNHPPSRPYLISLNKNGSPLPTLSHDDALRLAAAVIEHPSSPHHPFTPTMEVHSNGRSNRVP